MVANKPPSKFPDHPMSRVSAALILPPLSLTWKCQSCGCMQLVCSRARVVTVASITHRTARIKDPKVRAMGLGGKQRWAYVSGSASLPGEEASCS